MTINTAGLLAEFRELNAKRTPGPWESEPTGYAAPWCMECESWKCEHIPAEYIDKQHLWGVDGPENRGDGECRHLVRCDADFVAWCGTHSQALIESQAAEIAALRAELAETPPKLEWLRSVAGEPQHTTDIWLEWDNGLLWDKHYKQCWIAKKNGDDEELLTRAAVEAFLVAKSA